MKLSKKIISIILAIILIVGNTGVLYAANIIDMDSTNVQNLRPTITGSTNVLEMVENILGVVRNLGIIVTVVLLTIVGFSTILGSASEKAAAQSKYIGFIVGAILITSVSAIAKMLISFAEGIG